WMGYHVGSYLTDALFYPEPPVPVESMPKEYYAGQKGAGANLIAAAGIKKAVSIPVTVVGRMDADMGERAIEEGKIDFVAMTRRLIADPEYPKKVAAGRMEDIAPCTGCDNCLGSRRCRVNGLVGTAFNTIEKAERKKKVLVIGGGPAGMSAARVSALRGHDVTLYEKAGRLGGLLPLAYMVKGPHPENLPLLIEYFTRQLRGLGVKVVLGHEADLATVEAVKPDAVFLATGGVSTTPEIPGIEKSIVVSGAALHGQLKFFLKFFEPLTLRNLSKFYMPLGKRVIVIGGAIQGCELAEFLTHRGRSVTIVEKNEMIGEGMVDALLDHLMIWFKKKGVRLIGGVREYVEIKESGLTIIDRDGQKLTLKADTIVSALPLTPENSMIEGLRVKVPEVYAVGDCCKPALIADAIGSGLRTAREI
ncbi:MAG: FAD-dependent oxidoreductase, partial [Acidobacteriota bacterium]|nr:FAD-dependent oxidoreductase [Acidobacteriota bacterium]